MKTDDLNLIFKNLLGREEIQPVTELLSKAIKGQSILVTGAGGSIGSELCKQIIKQSPSRIVLLEHSEYNLYTIHHELVHECVKSDKSISIEPILGNIQDFQKLLEVMNLYKIETVYHAAAYKHVPIIESNIIEGINNNVIGTLNTAQASVQANVKNCVFISTDKAIRPSNIMGCTKRLSEMAIQAISNERILKLFCSKEATYVENNTLFTIVRFGNVMNSSGSVIPLFRDQISKGGPVTVTHPSASRYFITIEEAAQLVIQAGSIGQSSGEIYTLDMGDPVPIKNLAERMIKLFGKDNLNNNNSGKNIDIQYIGLRPGETVYEDVVHGDYTDRTSHPRIQKINEGSISWNAFTEIVLNIQLAIRRKDIETIRAVMTNTCAQ